ncbi:MAG: hypothetical protein RL136_2617 [Planctomycetota bacterium]
MASSEHSSHGSNDDHFHLPPVGGGESQRERFQAREIATVLSHYDLGVITNIREYRRGSRRSPKLRLDTERGTMILKRKSPGYLRARAEAGHALQTRAADAGVPVAALVPLRHGGTLLSLPDVAAGAGAERLYEIFEWVDGSRYERDPAQAEEAGAALARLHAAFAPVRRGDALPIGGFSDTDAVRRSLFLADASASVRLDPAARAELGSLIDALDRHIGRIERKLGEKGLAEQRVSLCHGDFHPGNTLWLGVVLGAVIDFDSARHESVAAEVANALLQFSLKHRVGEDPDAWQVGLDGDRLRAFAEGYRSQPATVPHAEIAPLIPWLMLSAVIAEAAAPIARDGDFAGIPALPFLRATVRLVDWIGERTRAVSSAFGA